MHGNKDPEQPKITNQINKIIKTEKPKCRRLFITVLTPGKSRMEVPADSVPGEGPSSWFADSHLLATSSQGRDRSDLSFLRRMLILSRGPTLILITCEFEGEGSGWMGVGWR